MTTDIKYQIATENNANDVVKLHTLLYNDDNTKTALMIRKQVSAALNNKTLWVAKDSNRVVGYILCELFDKKHRYFPYSIFIDGLFVIDEYRKRGIGKNLIKKVLNSKFPSPYSYFSITHDPKSVHLSKFYRSLGFSKNGMTDAGNIKLIKAI